MQKQFIAYLLSQPLPVLIKINQLLAAHPISWLAVPLPCTVAPASPPIIELPLMPEWTVILKPKYLFISILQPFIKVICPWYQPVKGLDSS